MFTEIKDSFLELAADIFIMIVLFFCIITLPFRTVYNLVLDSTKTTDNKKETDKPDNKSEENREERDPNYWNRNPSGNND